jgi:mRNA-degrading endonuclease RelE of RelBE toxin-antitoxin system
MPLDNGLGLAELGILTRLEAFVRGSETGNPLLPWAGRLSAEAQARLRSDLAVVLAEPEQTGEPVDWQEIGEILQEWAEIAGWEDLLIQTDGRSPAGPFTVDLHPREQAALKSASPAVRKAMLTLLTEFLPLYPTSGQLLPRGRLKKLKNREIWQVALPDGYRLLYAVDKRAKAIHIVYFGPHPDRDPHDRERLACSRIKRHGDGDP